LKPPGGCNHPGGGHPPRAVAVFFSSRLALLVFRRRDYWNNLSGQIISMIINSQITKAHDFASRCHISSYFYNSSLIWEVIIKSKLVGISEAIRLILIFIKLKLPPGGATTRGSPPPGRLLNLIKKNIYLN
jgi:hypothetical protein